MKLSTLHEMVTCGVIADRPNILGSKKRKYKKSGKLNLPSNNNRFGVRVPIISQTGGRLGGNKGL